MVGVYRGTLKYNKSAPTDEALMGQNNGQEDARARGTWSQMRSICLPNAPEIRQHGLSFLVRGGRKKRCQESEAPSSIGGLFNLGIGQKEVDSPAVGGIATSLVDRSLVWKLVDLTVKYSLCCFEDSFQCLKNMELKSAAVVGSSYRISCMTHLSKVLVDA
jgi:hypothetical protein